MKFKSKHPHDRFMVIAGQFMGPLRSHLLDHTKPYQPIWYSWRDKEGYADMFTLTHYRLNLVENYRIFGGGKKEFLRK